MNRNLLLLFFYFAIFNLCQSSNAQNQFISADSLKKHVFILGSDKFQGRGTGTTGEVFAGDYIVSVLKKNSVASPNKLVGYFQEIPMHGSKILPTSEMVLENENHKTCGNAQEQQNGQAPGCRRAKFF